MLHRVGTFARAFQRAAWGTRVLSAGQTEHAISKQALLKLRKSTGYSVYNCRKALLQFGEERIEDAEKWLREEARKEGWAKAAKLSSRSTHYGLVGVTTEGHIGALVELNCETDFVANSAEFKALVEEVALAAIDWGNSNMSTQKPDTTSNVVPLTTNIETIETRNSRAVKEAIALAVGTLKENITISRVEVVFSQPDVTLRAYAHPNTGTSTVYMGQYAAFLGLVRVDSAATFPTSRLSEQLCQHIIGIRPESLGTPPETAPPTSPSIQATADDDHDELNAFEKVESTHFDEDQTELLKQSFMLNPSQTVHEYITSHAAKVLWFSRTEMGEKNVKTACLQEQQSAA